MKNDLNITDGMGAVVWREDGVGFKGYGDRRKKVRMLPSESVN